jgi:acetyl esterase/lipase
MIHSFLVPTFAYDDTAVPADLKDLNEFIYAEHAKRPDPWSLPIDVIRKARRDGKTVFPATAPDPDAEVATVRGHDNHETPVRIIRPKGRKSCGVFLHFHGGGWIVGAAKESDVRLRRFAEATGLTTVSVDYRLAPEHPFPAAFDDCLAAARAVISPSSLDLPRGFLAIGGESAGAHLSIITLLRLRDKDGGHPFAAANLVAGFYDLSLTPSAADRGKRHLILNSDDLDRFARFSLPQGMNPRDPSVSPLYADLRGMPPARFSCGSKDFLLDDTLYMATRWSVAGGQAQVAITPGGCHVFEAFGTPSGDQSLTAAETYINERIAQSNS